MAEYIERDALLAAYDKAHDGPPGAARKLIESAPIAEVVPVVRCRECRYSSDVSDVSVDGCYLCNRKILGLVRAGDFCSFGKRKVGEADA